MGSVAFAGSRRLIAVATMLASALWVLTPGMAAAAGNAPCGTFDPDNPHAGSWRHSAAVGAEARIEFPSTPLCTGPIQGGNGGYSGSFTYVSVEVYGGTSAILQVGIGKCVAPTSFPVCTGGYRYWYAWGRQDGIGTCTTGHPADPIDLGPASSGTHKFTVYRTSTQVVFKIDGITKATIGIANVSCWTANAMSGTGEVYDHSDQMGGVVGDHQQITLALYEETVGGQWLSPSWSTCETQLAVFDCARINGQAVDVWTDRS